ncbi:MAG: hypothetical protein AAF493_18075 [Pseudomonadota bacterium]
MLDTTTRERPHNLSGQPSVDNLDERRRELLIQVESALENGAKEPGALKVWAEWLRARIAAE